MVTFDHRDHERLNFRIEGRPSALIATGFASPVKLEGSSMPSYDRIGLNNQDGTTPARPDTRQNHPKQSIAVLNLRTILLTLEYDKLMTKGYVLSRQLRHDIEPAVNPTAAISDNFEHQRTLHSEDTMFNVYGPDEYLRGTGAGTDVLQVR